MKPRTAAIAAYVDRLPEGADISIKTLAGRLPYGQQAVGSALRQLSEAGHLRRVRERPPGCSQWVTRTYFSRVPRTDAWWAAFAESGEWDAEASGPEETGTTDIGEARAPEPVQPPQPEEPEVTEEQPVSRGYGLLARLGEADHRMGLSAADCAALAPLVEEWFARGADEGRVVAALTAGLPGEGVHSPRAVAAWRLEHKLPPRPPAPVRTRTLRLVECTVCRTPGRPEALPGGLCRECRGEERRGQPGTTPAVDVHRKVAAVRAAMGLRPRAARPGDAGGPRRGTDRGAALAPGT